MWLGFVCWHVGLNQQRMDAQTFHIVPASAAECSIESHCQFQWIFSICAWQCWLSIVDMAHGASVPHHQ